MCGIAGILKLNDEEVSRSDLERMMSFLTSRGPDSSGINISSHIGLAHTRLSIVDLSEAGNQPMFDHQNRCAISFNGEIYNYKSLKNDLIKEGAKFIGDSDTEVIIQGFLIWGIDGILSRVEGMFAFAIYHFNTRTLFLCRDRFGQKPLYFFRKDYTIKFSSDIRSIAKTESNLTIDLESVDYYLTELSTPQPKTIWNEVQQIPPAHYLKISVDSKSEEKVNYWKLEHLSKLSIDYKEAENMIEEELIAAVGKRIHGDVPIGSFLSGGIDSGLVTAILAQKSAEKIKTFNVGFTYQPYDESQYARELASKYDTDHHEITMEASNVMEVLDSLIEYFGEPFSDPSMIPSYYICSEISKKTKVALSGDGGDELFGGYHEYRDAYYADYLKNQPYGIRKALILASKINSRFFKSSINLGSANTFLKHHPAQKLYRQMGVHDVFPTISIYKNDLKKDIRGYTESILTKLWESYYQDGELNALMRSSIDSRLLNNYLVKVDRTSMYCSLEVRSPFMDHKLAQLAFDIPVEFHLKDGHTKYILKKLAKSYISPDIFERKKMGFGIPIHQWLFNDLKEFVLSRLDGEDVFINQFIDPKYKSDLLTKFRNKTPGLERQIWGLLCLEIWGQKNIHA